MAQVKFKQMKYKLDTADERICFLNFDSSNLDSVAYNLDSKLLFVVFKSNTKVRYVYNDFPMKEFVKLATAGSVGAHMNKIKNLYQTSTEPNQ